MLVHTYLCRTCIRGSKRLPPALEIGSAGLDDEAPALGLETTAREGKSTLSFRDLDLSSIRPQATVATYHRRKLRVGPLPVLSVPPRGLVSIAATAA